MKKRAFLSVSDKTGIVDFARELDALGLSLIHIYTRFFPLPRR